MKSNIIYNSDAMIYWGQQIEGVHRLTPKYTLPDGKYDRVTFQYAIMGQHACENCQGGWVTDSPQNFEVHLTLPADKRPKLKKQGINDEAMIAQINKRKEDHGYETILSIGWFDGIFGVDSRGSHSTYFFSDMLLSSERRASFSASAINLAKQFGFDGIEISWRYPGDPKSLHGGRNSDFANLQNLAREFKTKYPKYKLSIRLRPYLSQSIIQADYGILPGYPDGVKYTMNNDQDYYDWLVRLIHAGFDDIQIEGYHYYEPGINKTTLPNAPYNFTPKSGLTGELKGNNDIQKSLIYGPDPAKFKNSSINPNLIETLLLIYNIVTPSGTPDYETFFKDNKMKMPSNPSKAKLAKGQSYVICASQHVYNKGDVNQGFYGLLCNTYGWESGPGNKVLKKYCGGDIENAVLAYSDLNATPSEGDKITMPIPSDVANQVIANKKGVASLCTGPAPTPPTPGHSINQTLTGLSLAFNRHNQSSQNKLVMKDHVWLGIPFFGTTYAGVDFHGAATKQEKAAFGKSYQRKAPGGWFSGSCGEQGCGALTIREINTLMSKGVIPNCTDIGWTGRCHDPYQWNLMEGDQYDAETLTIVAFDPSSATWISFDNVNSLNDKYNLIKKSYNGQQLHGIYFMPQMDTEEKALTYAMLRAAGGNQSSLSAKSTGKKQLWIVRFVQFMAKLIKRLFKR